MSLDNLIGISLEKIEADATAIQRLLAAVKRNLADATAIQRLLAAVKRNLADAGVSEISSENRFGAAYKAIMQLANAALQANGYRTLTSRPGHHMTMIQPLSQTLGLDKQTIIILDQLRKQRNVADYSGDIVPESATRECIDSAKQLLQKLESWLRNNKPELLS